MTPFHFRFRWSLVLWFFLPVPVLPGGVELAPDWGVDACLSCHVPPEHVGEWLGLLRKSGVRILRERDTGRHAFNPALRDYRATYRQAKEAGFMVVAFGRETAALPGVNKRWGVSPDLAAVYAEGRRIGREYAAYVDVWELHNEPDTGYVPDLPDFFMAHEKALYLGLKAGAKEAGKDTPVIMGALGALPGPWWERAVDNGLLDYADAYNFHFYGNADELTAVVGAHRVAQREAMRGYFSSKFKLKITGRPADRSAYQSVVNNPRSKASLPLWITECGVDAMIKGDFFNAERRAYQAEFTVETARQALSAPDVAVFMPFILVHQGDPHAMVVAQNITPLPAWDAYARFTRENPWPKRKLFEAAGERASPVVLQWLPAAGTASHKVAGTYRVHDGETITGEMRIYNFGGQEAVGSLELGERWTVGGERNIQNKSREATLRVQAGGMIAVPVTYTSREEPGYFRDKVKARFCETSGRRSQVVFDVERKPVPADFTMIPLQLSRVEGDGRLQLSGPWQAEDRAVGPWRLFNGLVVEDGGAEKPQWDVNGLRLPGDASPVVKGHQDAGQGANGAGSWRFKQTKPNHDPLVSTYALAAVTEVPKDARFLRVKMDRPMDASAYLRVYLGDKHGQRFTIWENLGRVYGDEASRELWLALEDFHPFAWSQTITGQRRLKVEDIREISLRLYLQSGETRTVLLEWAREKPLEPNRH